MPVITVVVYDEKGIEIENILTEGGEDLNEVLERYHFGLPTTMTGAKQLEWLINDVSDETGWGTMYFGYGVIPEKLLKEYPEEKISVRPPEYRC